MKGFGDFLRILGDLKDTTFNQEKTTQKSLLNLNSFKNLTVH